MKRKYIGWRVVQNTVAEEPNKTALQIAKEYGFCSKAVRTAAKRLGIALPPSGLHGGRRFPCNQWDKKQNTISQTPSL